MGDRIPQVLVVEDEPGICQLIRDALAPYGVQCQAVHTGHEARRRLLEGDIDVAVLDLALPDVSGLDLLELVFQHKLSTRVICISGVGGDEASALACRAGAWEFVRKPFDATELAKTIARAAGRSVPAQPRGQIDSPAVAGAPAGIASRSRQMLLEFAGALVRAVEAKDAYTRRHSEHVAFYAENLARYAGLPRAFQDAIRMAALLHDIGKIAVPDSILTKPTRLTEEEFAFIRQHPNTGADILENISLMSVEARFVRQHHENWDGSGYPEGLAGERISIGGRILNIADSIDAMLMHRTYKESYPVERMLSELRRCAGSQFDPTLARLAIQWCQQNPDKLILPSERRRAATA